MTEPLVEVPGITTGQPLVTGWVAAGTVRKADQSRERLRPQITFRAGVSLAKTSKMVNSVTISTPSSSPGGIREPPARLPSPSDSLLHSPPFSRAPTLGGTASPVGSPIRPRSGVALMEEYPVSYPKPRTLHAPHNRLVPAQCCSIFLQNYLGAQRPLHPGPVSVRAANSVAPSSAPRHGHLLLLTRTAIAGCIAGHARSPANS